MQSILKPNTDIGKLYVHRRREPSPQVWEQVSEYGKEIGAKYKVLETLTFREARELLQTMQRFNDMSRQYPILTTIMYPQDNITKVVDHMKSSQPVSFQPIIMDSEEMEVNGYKLYSCDSLLFWYDEYQGYCKYWEEEDDMTFDAFKEECHERMCTSWCKMDEHGESFGGYWDYPEDSLEYRHAYSLTQDKNIRCLWRLPYPKRFLLETINIGCNNGMESVRYSNTLGEWMVRMMNST